MVTDSPLPTPVGLTGHLWKPVESGESGWIFRSDSSETIGFQWSTVDYSGFWWIPDTELTQFV